MRYSPRRLATVIGLPLLAGITLLLSTCTAKDTAFTLTATTDVLSVEPLCDQELVWDLGDGEVAALGSGREHTDTPARHAGHTSVHLRGGARAVLERRPDGLWRIDLTRGPLHQRCTALTQLPSVVVTVSPPNGPSSRRPADTAPPEQRLELSIGTADGPQALSVRTVRPAASPDTATKAKAASEAKGDPDAKPSGTVLLLSGRVVLGEPLRHGGGWSAASSPLLREGKLEARTRDVVTARSLPVIEEPLDAGSRVDTHACLEQAEAPAQLACMVRTSASASGLVYDNVDRALAVKLHVTTERIGIAQHGGEQRAVAITWWSRFISLQFVQMFAATLLLLCTLVQTLFALPATTRPTS